MRLDETGLPFPPGFFLTAALHLIHRLPSVSLAGFEVALEVDCVRFGDRNVYRQLC